MSEPRYTQARMPSIGQGPSILEGANVGSINGGNYYSIQGGTTTVIHQTSLVHSGYVPPDRTSDADVDVTVSMLEQWAVALVEFRRIHEDIADKRTEGTGESFKSKQEVQNWINGVNKFLWITGGPGAGKTYLASVMIDETESMAERMQGMAVAFAYLRYTEKLSTWDIILSLIIQLVLYSHQTPEVATLVRGVVDRHRRRRAKPSLDELVKLLKGILKRFPDACIILDGLDEMLVEVQRMIIKIFSSVEVRVLFTSRPMILMEERVKALMGDQAVFMNIAAQPEDLDLFITKAIDENPSLSKLLDIHNLKDAVVASIKEKAGGMFLHASLQVEMLEYCRSLQSIRDTISQIPPRIEDLYASTVKRIPDGDAALARLTLTWLVHVKGNLRIEDLQHAVAVSPGGYQFEAGRHVSEEDIVSVCRGLISVEAQTRYVRLIHYTAREALGGLLAEYMPQPHVVIAKTCVSRLIDCGFQHTQMRTLGDLKQAFADNPLLEYAKNNAPYHVRRGIEANRDFQVWMEQFVRDCESYPHFLAITALLDDAAYGSKDSDPLSLFPPLHTAAHFGLVEVVFRMVQVEGVDVNTLCGPINPVNEDDNLVKCTSLALASMEGDDVMVEALLDLPGSDIAQSDWESIAGCLAIAATCGHASTVKIFLDLGKIDINNTKEGLTPLLVVSLTGQEAVMRMLLEVPGIDINYREPEGTFSALIIVSRMGHESLVKLLLLTPGIEVNSHTSAEGWTASSLAAYFGHISILKLLFDHPDHNPNLVTTNGGTILFQALSYNMREYYPEERDQDIDGQPGAHFLLDQPEIQQLAHIPDNRGRTPLMMASRFGYSSIVERLLAIPGGDVNATTDDDQTALMMASEKGHDDVVAILLASGAIPLGL